MNLNINLATRVYVNFKRVNSFLALLFLLCFVWMAFNLYRFASNQEQMNKYTEFISRTGRGGEGKAVSDAEYAKLVADIKNVNGILYKRSYDWISLLENMEKLVPAGVALRSLAPHEKGESIKLTGTATGFSSIRRFVENLESSKSFTEIYLTDLVNTTVENKRQAINFTVTCKASIL
jgi:type IV pilus assembly protein PilN